jgi:hypothetical protein
MIKKIIFFLPLLLLLAGCDKGIAPLNEVEETGFSGKITFKGTWPSDIKRTHIIVFKEPVNSASDFNILNLGYIGKEIPSGVSFADFNTNQDTSYFKIQPGTYKYVVVAQSSTEQVSLERKDWKVAGIYYLNNNTNTPGTLVIPENTMVKGINIICDFDNPPPQPPGGE